MISKYILNIKEYPRYIKTVNERYIKPRLFVLSNLKNEYNPNFKAPTNIFQYPQSDLENFGILSYKLNIFKKIDWYKDISSNRVWPKVDYKRIKVCYQDNSDIKYIWEIGRLQFLIPLGAVYKKTKDERFAIRFKEIINDFYKENPAKLGPNWKCTMDVGIRAVNLIYAYSYFKDSKSIHKEFWNNYFNELYKTGQFIYNNLEWAPIRGNHYISDIVGLFYLGVIFKKIKLGKKWLSFSKKELESEINTQLNYDGVDYEGSISYHRLVFELFLYSYIFGKDNDVKFSIDYISKLKGASEFVYAYTMNSGSSPQIGDNDSGQLLKLNNKRNINDHRYILQLSDVYLKTKFNQTNIEPETIFFSGIKKIRKNNLNSICKSFSQGYSLYRDKNLFFGIRCGQNGLLGRGGHNHNDQLSFVLEYNKQYFFVDPGTYNYTGYPELRDRFRSTDNHNTMFVNKIEQGKLDVGLFTLPLVTKNRTLLFSQTKKGFIYIGKQNISNIIIKRDIVYNKVSKELIITDLISGNQYQNVKFNFILHPNVLISTNKNDIILTNNKVELKLFIEDQYHIEETLYSEKYGSKVKTKKIVINTNLEKSKFNWKIKLL